MIGSTKWHYFVSGSEKSLCNRWRGPGITFVDTEDKNHWSRDNCKECKKRREKRESDALK